MNYNYSNTGLLKEIGTETNTTVYANSGKYNDAGILTQLIAGNTLELTQSIDDANKEHSKDIVYTNNYGAKINNSEIRTPHPGIDYIKAYEESKKNENKKDE